MYKQHDVVMLSTEKASYLCLKDNELINANDGGCMLGYDPPKWLTQHLYIVSDEDINSGDWVIKRNEPISQVFAYTGRCKEEGYKKIIATTNKLELYSVSGGVTETEYIPQIPQQFIEQYITEYNKGNIYTKVQVEYGVFNSHVIGLNKLKLTDNTININMKRVKDNYSREEVESLLFKYAEDEHAWFSTKGEIKSFNNWIKDNL